jgi:hypothetical protein
MPLPTFLVLGAMKAGTTALNHYLRQHPEIYVNPFIKESHYFSLQDWEDANYRTWEAYVAIFDGVTTEKALGDNSPSYLAHPQAAQHIYERIPDVKLIAILRNPIDRAYSHYYHERVRDVKYRETIDDFLTAFHAHDHRPLGYKNRGFYYRNISRYDQYFAPEQFMFILYEDYKRKQKETMQALYRFIEVDDQFEPEIEWGMRTGKPRSMRLLEFLRNPSGLKDMLKAVLPADFRQRLRKSIYNANIKKTEPMSPAIRQELIDVYRDDILQLSERIERDLSHWLTIPDDQH